MAHALIRRLFDGRLPELVMFDLDGTLLDSVPDIARAVDRTLEAQGLAIAGRERVHGWVGRGSRSLIREALAWADGGTPEQVAPARLESALHFYLETYGAHCAEQSALMPGAAALLRALRANGVSLACVTNKPAAITARVLAQLMPDAGFGMVLGGDSGAGAKPGAGPLLAAMEGLGAEPARSLMVGDSRHDVNAARAAGVAVICVAGGYNHGEDIRCAAPDLVVGDLAELL